MHHANNIVWEHLNRLGRDETNTTLDLTKELFYKALPKAKEKKLALNKFMSFVSDLRGKHYIPCVADFESTSPRIILVPGGNKSIYNIDISTDVEQLNKLLKRYNCYATVTIGTIYLFNKLDSDSEIALMLERLLKN